MLPPHERNLLLETLRPPPGYALDRAIGTTFTLNLLTLLTAPLAFTFFNWEEEGGEITADPLALLEALRRHADRIHLFCHAGQIAVPPPDQKLLGYLEDTVIEVLPPRRGAIFHPKVWLLRFVSPDGPVRYRFVCPTRNLTFDRSWDTVLVLEGDLTSREYAFAKNHPLGDFVAALPGMAVRRPVKATRTAIDRMQDEVRRVRFEPPDDFDDFEFVPLGIPNSKRWRFPLEGADFLVVSPFLSEGLLGSLAERQRIRCLISRSESLEKLPHELLEPIAESIYVMADEAALDSHAADESEEDEVELAGLHAKLFVADWGWNASVWTGSANATDAAFTNNVEFLVGLHGKKSRCGIDAFLGAEDDRYAFRNLVLRYPLHEEEVDEGEEEAIARQLEAARLRLVEARLTAKVEPTEEDEVFDLAIRTGSKRELAIPEELTVALRPVTLRAGRERPVTESKGEIARFEAVSFEALTSFVAVKIRVRGSRKERDSIEFVLNLPIEGAPSNRRERMLESLLENKEQVLRLLLLLLAGEGLSMPEFLEAFGKSGTWQFQPLRQFGQRTLLEALLQALDGSPEILDQVHRLIEDLERSEKGRNLLPDGFEAVWDPVWSARGDLEEA